VTIIPLAHGGAEARTSGRDALAVLRAKAQGLDARGLLELAIRDEFPGRIAVISSFAAESIVLHVALSPLGH
jgi:hypothetical protein